MIKSFLDRVLQNVFVSPRLKFDIGRYTKVHLGLFTLVMCHQYIFTEYYTLRYSILRNVHFDTRHKEDVDVRFNIFT